MPSSLLNWTRRSSTESTGSPGCRFGRSTGSAERYWSFTPVMSTSPCRLRIEGVSQAVAQEVHAEHGDQEAQTREVQQIGVRCADGILRPVEHGAPRHLRGLDAEAEERQRGLQNNCVADDKCGVDGNGP